MVFRPFGNKGKVEPVAPILEAVKQEAYIAPQPVQAAPKKKYQIVAKYPMQEVRQVIDENGVIWELLTVEDALTKQLNGEI